MLKKFTLGMMIVSALGLLANYFLLFVFPLKIFTANFLAIRFYLAGVIERNYLYILISLIPLILLCIGIFLVIKRYRWPLVAIIIIYGIDFIYTVALFVADLCDSPDIINRIALESVLWNGLFIIISILYLIKSSKLENPNFSLTGS